MVRAHFMGKNFKRIIWSHLKYSPLRGSRITNFDRLEMIDWKKTCHHVAKMFEEYKFLEAPIDNSSQYSILYPYALETSQRTETITKHGQLSPQFQVGKGRPFITQRLFFSAPPPKKCLKDPKSKTIPVQITIPVQEILKFSELTLVNPLFCIEFWGFPDVSSP
jgi:hypothetical protein